MRALRWLDENIEKIIILVNYVAMAAIIFVEVIRRFLFNEQAAWSSTIPIYLFLWICWIGCAYNVKIRAHLKFDELRTRMPYKAQFACLMLDAVLWIIFAVIVIVFTTEQVQLAYDNFAIVQGTDNVMQWWFYLATPLAFSLLIYRVVQNVLTDVAAFRKGAPLQVKANIFGD
ncbi:MAG: TRAP transporter small permease [Alphaproteobacteria bacterium]|nr:MAG: TRAP transporter small permease [Alphaproteobacteria bacterium]